MIAGAFLLTAMDACSKWLADDYSLAQIMFLRGVISIVVIAALVRRDEGAAGFRMQRPWVHVARAVGLCCLTYAVVFALKRMPLADLGALFMLSPLFMTAFGVFLLKERIGVWRVCALLAGFVGMLVIMRPGTAVFTPVALVAVACALGYALLMVSTRVLSSTETTGALTFYPQLGVCVISAALVPFAWTSFGWQDAILFLILGLSAGLGHLCLTLAFRNAPVGVIAPFEYSGLIWAVGLGYWIFGDLPDGPTFLGMGFIAVAGLVVIHRQNTQRRSVPA